MRIVLLLGLWAGGLCPAADWVSAMYNHQIDLVRNDVVSLAKAMPAGKYDFAPKQGNFKDVRTFGEQVKHIATMIYMTAALALGEKSPYGPGTNNNGPDTIRGKEDILKYLDASLAYARKAADSLNASNLGEPVRTYFGSQSRAEVISGIAFHSFNHYGQMVVYARMNGIVPPASVPPTGSSPSR